MRKCRLPWARTSRLHLTVAAITVVQRPNVSLAATAG